MSEFCVCGCHRGALLHFAPCCRLCVYCWRYVNFDAYERHGTTCEAKLKATETAFVLPGETHADRLPGFHASDKQQWWYPKEFNAMTSSVFAGATRQ